MLGHFRRRMAETFGRKPDYGVPDDKMSREEAMETTERMGHEVFEDQFGQGQDVKLSEPRTPGPRYGVPDDVRSRGDAEKVDERLGRKTFDLGESPESLDVGVHGEAQSGQPARQVAGETTLEAFDPKDPVGSVWGVPETAPEREYASGVPDAPPEKIGAFAKKGEPILDIEEVPDLGDYRETLTAEVVKHLGGLSNETKLAVASREGDVRKIIEGISVELLKLPPEATSIAEAVELFETKLEQVIGLLQKESQTSGDQSVAKRLQALEELYAAMKADGREEDNGMRKAA